MQNDKNQVKEAQLFNIIELVSDRTLVPIIFATLVYEKKPIRNCSSNKERKELVIKILKRVWKENFISFANIQYVCSFQYNRGDQFHIHLVIFQNGVGDEKVDKIIKDIISNHGSNGSVEAEKYLHSVEDSFCGGIKYLYEKAIIDPSEPLALSRKLKRTLRCLRNKRGKRSEMLQTFKDLWKNKRIFVSAVTKMPHISKFRPENEVFLKEYSLKQNSLSELFVALVKDNIMHLVHFNTYEEGKLNNADMQISEQLEYISNNSKEVDTHGIYFSPKIDEMIRKNALSKR